MNVSIIRNELRKDHFTRFPISNYEDDTKQVILYGSVAPQNKITYIVFCSKLIDHGPWKNQEVACIDLEEAMAQYNYFVKE